jgi:hypothetical protein
MSDTKHEAIKQVVYAVPGWWAPVATWFLGTTLTDWVGYASILYCLLQSVYLVWRWKKEAKGHIK